LHRGGNGGSLREKGWAWGENVLCEGEVEKKAWVIKNRFFQKGTRGGKEVKERTILNLKRISARNDLR